jgi:serine/threonine protein kinase
MFEYACFLHPQEKSTSLEGACPQCGRKFRWPLDVLPREINGKVVEAGLGRGFYGAVYRVRRRRLSAIKVIPKAMYAPTEEGGHAKDFDQEADHHADLTEDSEANLHVAAYIDAGEEILDFGGILVDCWWLEMEYLDGRPLSEVIDKGPRSPQEAAQIALDLLDVVDVLEKRGWHHNDLHSDNIFVVPLGERRARRQAISPLVNVKLLDLGSLGEKSKSGPDRLGDVHWIATHIRDILDSYERRNPQLDPGELRLTAQLRRVAELYSGQDPDHRPTPSDMRKSVQDIYAFGERPWGQPVRLGFIAEHYNAQSLPPWFAPELLNDPDGEWTKRISGPGPTLIAGMRGCGKTILLRSLEWTARLHRQEGETEHQVLTRLEEDRFLGLFVSCSALLRQPRGAPLNAPFQRLFLAFAREVIRDVHACELDGVGAIHYNALPSFVEVVERIVPWFERPSSSVDIISLERRLDAALQEPEPADGDAPFNARTAFDELAQSSRRLVDLWTDKTLLFLLDDVSIRYLPIENVEQLLSQFSLQSPDFGFKVSTETQTLELSTPGGSRARRYRDYDFFDLGAEVYAHCDPKSPFLEKVLEKRSRLTDGEQGKTPVQVLGRQDLISIARTIKSQPAKTPVYWGLEALGGMCNGDIGDILRLYTTISEQARQLGEYPLSPAEQHAAALALTENRLLSLAGRGDWYYRHAVAFAQASNFELAQSRPDGPRQYTGMRVNIQQGQAEEVFGKLMELVDAGVFVLTGSTNRTKGPKEAPYVQFKLAYSTVLGLSNRVPLSKRDRFELPTDQLLDWLAEPSAAKLRPIRRRSAAAETVEGMPEPVAESGQPGHTTPEAHSQLDLVSLESSPSLEVSDGGDLPRPRVLFDVETVARGRPGDLDVDWSESQVIGAYGFEERSVGAWQNLLKQVTPRGALLASYPDMGLRAQLDSVLLDADVPSEAFEAADLSTEDGAMALVERTSADVPMIDVTALSKSLIFTLVRAALLARGEVVVLHTEAASYFPPDEELADVVKLLKGREHLEAFARLDEIVSGEIGPYETVAVGAEHRDPSQPPVMAAFVALKFNRVQHVLDDLPVEQVFAIAPVSSRGPDSPRTVVARYLAQYFVQRYGGEVFEIGSQDHDGAYRRLRSLHQDYALQAGHNFELALTGSKMHTVAAGMLAATVRPAGVHYSRPQRFKADRYTIGTGDTVALRLRRFESTPPVRDA